MLNVEFIEKHMNDLAISLDIKCPSLQIGSVSKLASYDPNKNVLHLNQGHEGTPRELLNSIAHEMRHAFQVQNRWLLACHRKSRPNKHFFLWRGKRICSEAWVRFTYAISGWFPGLYNALPWERDANEFARKIVKSTFPK